MRKTVLFLLFIASSALIGAEKEFPTPFYYIEKLNYQPSNSTFYMIKSRTPADQVIYKNDERDFYFKNRSKPLKGVERVEGTTFFLFEGSGSICCTYHFFHILEHIVGLWAFYGEQHAQEVKQIVLASAGELTRPPWVGLVWEGPNEINKHLLRALFPNAQILTWPMFVDTYQGRPFSFERALISDRRISYEFPGCSTINRMLGVARHSISQDSMKHLADRVNAYAGTVIEKTEALRVTFLKRAPPRTLIPETEEKLLAAIRMLPNVTLRVEDFVNLSFKEQINIIGNTDVLISVHGNGLSHTLFLPPSSKVIEIFPPGVHTVDYRIFAEIRGFEYTCIMSNRGIISKEESYRLGAVGEFNSTVYDLDIPLVLNAIRPLYTQDDSKVGRGRVQSANF